MDFNLPELLVVDLEQSTTLFQSEQLTSGAPAPSLADNRSRRHHLLQDIPLSIKIPSHHHHDPSIKANARCATHQSDAHGLFLNTLWEDSNREGNSSGSESDTSIGPHSEGTARTNITTPTNSAVFNTQSSSPHSIKRLSNLNRAGISWVDTESDESDESDELEPADLKSIQTKMSPQRPSPARQEGQSDELSFSSSVSSALARAMDRSRGPYVDQVQNAPVSNLRNEIPERGSSLGHTDCNPQVYLNDASPRPRPKFKLTQPLDSKVPPAAGMETEKKYPDGGSGSREEVRRNPSLDIIPKARIEAWMEAVIDAWFQFSLPYIDGPVRTKPLPESVIDSIKVTVRSFPDVMLKCDSVSVEMIRSQWRKVKIPGSKKHDLGAVFGGSSLRGDAECWAVIKNVFRSGGDDLCEALYAYIMAYNHITMFTGPSRRRNTPPVPTAQDLSSHSRDHEHEHQPQPNVETPTTISHKAASFLGITSPPRQGPSAFQDPVPFPPPPPIPELTAPPPELPQSHSRVERLLLRPRKSFHDLFRKKHDIYEGIGDNASTSTNRLQKQPPRGIGSSQISLNQQQTLLGSSANLSRHQMPSFSPSNHHLPESYTNNLRHPFSKPSTPVPTTAARKWKKSKESNRDPSTWVPLSQSEAADTRAGGDEALRELDDLRIGLANCIAQIFAKLRQSSFSVEAGGSGEQSDDDRDYRDRRDHHRRYDPYNHRDQRRHEGREFSDLFGDQVTSPIFDRRGSISYASPIGLRKSSGASSSSHFSRDRVRAGNGKGEESMRPTEAVNKSPSSVRRHSPPPASGPLPLRVQAESDAAFIRTLCELVRAKEEALMRREEGNHNPTARRYQPYVRIGTPANK